MKTLRKSITPEANDTWESIAEQHLPLLDHEQAVAQLQSWNLHIFARRTINQGKNDAGTQPSNPILPSDILFLESPQTQRAEALS